MPFRSLPDIDLSRYVAVGDSITAGYADGALYYEGQLNSYANILAAQFGKLTGGAFTQPLMDPASPGVDMLGHSRLTLKRDERLPDNFILTHLSPTGDTAALQKNTYASQGPFHNMGVPGAKAISLVAPGFGNPANGPGNYNPFFTRIASDPARASVLSDALLLKPTFFTLFIGNNDALAYALSGGTENAMSAVSGPAGQGFEGSIEIIIDALTAHGAKGVIASLPSISSIPYFNAIPYNGLLLNAAEAEALNKHYLQANLSFHAGLNPFPVNDFISLPRKPRLAAADELILLDLILDENKEEYLTGKAPVPKKYTLIPEQIVAIEATIQAYNRTIRRVAEERGLGFVDVNALVKIARPDRHYDPATRNIVYQKRGVFSLDGLHPNAFGQALLANEFIRVINTAFHTQIPGVQSHRYKGITFPKA